MEGDARTVRVAADIDGGPKTPRAVGIVCPDEDVAGLHFDVPLVLGCRRWLVRVLVLAVVVVRLMGPRPCR